MTKQLFRAAVRQLESGGGAGRESQFWTELRSIVSYQHSKTRRGLWVLAQHTPSLLPRS